jgi:hypothetical protein
MSAGSGASNLGYGNLVPLSNVNGNYVNVNNSNNPSNFGSNEISGTPPGPLPGLGGTKINIDAAAGIYPGGLKGGASKILRKKIKNISKKYKKMKGGKKTRSSLRRRVLSRALSGGRKRNRYTRSHRNRTRSRKQRGGYSQYQNNLPLTPSYQVAGINLPPNMSALANPTPYTVLSAGANCIDNYNHFTGQGFPSRGH